MVATHATLLPVGAEAPDYEALASRYFGGNVLVGAGIAAGAGLALTISASAMASVACWCSTEA